MVGDKYLKCLIFKFKLFYNDKETRLLSNLINLGKSLMQVC